MRPILTIVLFVSCFCAGAQTTTYFNSDGIAIRGYDPVAYFTESKPVEGTSQFSYTWQGTRWHFKNQANLDLFKASPEKYAPQFGGYCAYGASENHKAPTDAAAFTIIDNKLYLNYNLKVKEIWMKDTKGRIEKADRYWVTLKDKND